MDMHYLLNVLDHHTAARKEIEASIEFKPSIILLDSLFYIYENTISCVLIISAWTSRCESCQWRVRCLWDFSETLLVLPYSLIKTELTRICISWVERVYCTYKVVRLLGVFFLFTCSHKMQIANSPFCRPRHSSTGLSQPSTNMAKRQLMIYYYLLWHGTICTIHQTKQPWHPSSMRSS